MSQTAVIAGVGPGLGASLARKFAREGCRVAMFARSAVYLRRLEAELKAQYGSVLAVPIDLTNPIQVADGFARVRHAFGPIDVLIHHAGNAVWKGLMELTSEQFEQAWRVGPYGGFLCAKEAASDMLNKGAGAMIFTGATSSVRGRGGALAFSSAKFGVRGLAESLARELWPKGIHVAHVVIDGVIDTPEVRAQYSLVPNDPLLSPDAIAESYWRLVQQDRSAWTLELDVRPFNEEFFV
jgi:NAD(P)-dependent dehydrogenase (short-subunit alcohol dehydrogenase family)